MYTVGCIWSASSVAVTNTTSACHCSRAMHEHYRTHENIPIVVESSELIAFGTEADRGFVEFDPARTFWHTKISAASIMIRISLDNITTIPKNIQRKPTMSCRVINFHVVRSALQYSAILNLICLLSKKTQQICYKVIKTECKNFNVRDANLWRLSFFHYPSGISTVFLR